MEIIDLTSFKKAVTSLISILERYERENHDIDIRDAVIKRFEYTFSTSVKIIYRYLKYAYAELDDTLSFNDAIRKANQSGILLTNLETWDIYRKKRNLTSHIYNEEMINDIIKIIPQFIDECNFLINKLEEKLK